MIKGIKLFKEERGKHMRHVDDDKKGGCGC